MKLKYAAGEIDELVTLVIKHYKYVEMIKYV